MGSVSLHHPEAEVSWLPMGSWLSEVCCDANTARDTNQAELGAASGIHFSTVLHLEP